MSRILNYVGTGLIGAYLLSGIGCQPAVNPCAESQRIFVANYARQAGTATPYATATRAIPTSTPVPTATPSSDIERAIGKAKEVIGGIVGKAEEAKAVVAAVTRPAELTAVVFGSVGEDMFTAFYQLPRDFVSSDGVAYKAGDIVKPDVAGAYLAHEYQGQSFALPQKLPPIKCVKGLAGKI